MIRTAAKAVFGLARCGFYGILLSSMVYHFAILSAALRGIAILFLFFPFIAQAAVEAGSVTEEFANTARREERATFAFWNTREGVVALPLQYSVKDLGVGLADLRGQSVTAIFTDGMLVLAELSGRKSYLIDTETGSAQDVTVPTADRAQDAARVKGLPQRERTPFASVAPRFSRVGQTIRSDATVEGDGRYPYVLDRGKLWVGIGGGIELGSGVMSELSGAQIRAVLKRADGAMLAAGIKNNRPLILELSLQGFAPSATLQTKKLAEAPRGWFFRDATIAAEADLPAGTDIAYDLSSDDGAHWEQVRAVVRHLFARAGDDLRLRATLSTTDPEATPRLDSVRVDFARRQKDDEATVRRRDAQRLSDLNTIAGRLERFKRDRKVYPVVDGRSARVRWEQLGRLLIDGEFVRTMPEDPLISEDRERSYDYISSRNGDAYILRALLEEVERKNLEQDVDGTPIDPGLLDYTCADPWYCVGRGFVEEQEQQEQQEQREAVVELLRAEDGKIYRIALLGGNGAQRKLYVPNPSLLEQLKNFYGRMRAVGRAEIERIPRAKLVRVENDPRIYYITETFLKRWIPTWDVFLSYGNNAREIVTIKAEELAAYGESRLIQLENDRRIWFLEGAVRRYVPNPKTFNTHGFKWDEVAPVNSAEFNAYTTGEPLE